MFKDRQREFRPISDAQDSSSEFYSGLVYKGSHFYYDSRSKGGSVEAKFRGFKTSERGRLAVSFQKVGEEGTYSKEIGKIKGVSNARGEPMTFAFLVEENGDKVWGLMNIKEVSGTRIMVLRHVEDNIVKTKSEEEIIRLNVPEEFRIKNS